MLQQTQVDRVARDYYSQFLTKFPSFASIASASEEDIVAQWEGLGYYNRARNLHKLAQEIMTTYHGQFPTDREKILALPGIGEYTTGAVMTFALNLRAPLVDTNVDRVYSRIFLYPGKDLTENQKNKILWLLAESLLPDFEYWEFNQGIMDFGAMICITPNPLCVQCPMKAICQHYRKSSLTRFLN
jgi:A/G-specific adenine glycosylase